ncbi:MAG: HD domain-containing protein [Thermodesulfobacteria bacterium]|nr:HD domain-containing protein [Thermodesulfobacteriota bacterium]
MDATNGYLVIKNIPNDSCREKIKNFLLKSVKNLDREKIDHLLKSTPLTLGGKIPGKTGRKIAKMLSECGATVIFKEHDEPEASHNTQDETVAKAGIELNADDKEDFTQNQDLKDTFWNDTAGETGDFSSPASESETASSEESDYSYDDGLSPSSRPLFHQIFDKIAEVNKELWIIFTMVAVAGLMNYLVTSEYMILGLYSFPTILSAYFYGRRHAVMTALLTIIIVGIMIHFNDVIFTDANKLKLAAGKWYHIMAWGSVLICTAYAMGTLYERHMDKVKELRKTYQGLIVILRHFISKDQYTENHCYRVSVYAAKIASYLGLDEDTIEDIRSAALLHDIGKLKVSRDLLYKAAKLSEDEYREIKKHVKNSEDILEPLKGPLGRIIPIILAHHDRYDGKGYRPVKGKAIPLGARILAVADVYDALTSDRPYRKAMAPIEAKEIIKKGAGKDFDPVVVDAFLKAFDRGEMDIPNFVV